ncbi:MAG TPA: extracellular solute-binding protein [Allosphingosinicella sp.]|nr:extracellular solute-binding protein [Allosphingosinicella sp.]
MKAWAFLALAAAALLGCSGEGARTEIYLQRFFGECGAVYGRSADVAAAEGECGIITTLINRFNAENPDIHVSANVVAWPGYPQLTAQLAARDPPDLVTMHQDFIADYQVRGLIEPMDALLRDGGIGAEDFTPAARRGVVKQGRIYGLPWDTVGGLWHINTRLFDEAGLMRNGRPILPDSPEELFAHARRFSQRTGKPYLVQSQVNDPATHVRNFYSYLLAQDVTVFPNPRQIRIDTPEARRVVALFRRLNEERLTTVDQDNPAAIASFMNGEGGVFPTGTWMIGPFHQDSVTPGRPLYRSYTVYPYPRLWGRPAPVVGGHAWVMPRRERTPEQRRALARLLRFMAAHNFDWSRTGHLPAFEGVVRSPAFRNLPHRANIAPLASTGTPFPAVQLQGPVGDLIGEEISAAVMGQKPVAQALADAERRVNELLSQGS